MRARALPAFELPAALRSQGFALRPETDDDVAFLIRLYASTREEELRRLLDWSADQKLAFLASQFHAQRHHYRTYITGCVFDILEQDGVPAGRLYLDAQPTRLHIVDITLLPEWRGMGIGTAILEGLKAGGRRIGIFVEKFNPALNLYRRLGFTEVADHGVYLEMEWPGDGQPAIS